MTQEAITRGPVIEGPDADGYFSVGFEGPGFAAFLGRFMARPEGETRARVRVTPGIEARNINGLVHGGYTLGFLDQAIFLGPAILKVVDPGQAVTLGVSTQFVGAAKIGEPLDCVVDVVRRTRQLLFVAGMIEQHGEPVLSFQGSLRTFEKRITPQ